MLMAVIIKVIIMAEKKSHHLQSREEDGLESWIKYHRTFIWEIAVHVLCETNTHHNLRQLGCFTYIT